MKKIIAASLCLMLSTSLFASADWTNSQGNAARTNSLPIHTNPDKYSVAWSQHWGPDTSRKAFVDTPIIADHILFFSLSGPTWSRNGVSVYALNTDTGTQKWGRVLPQIYYNKFYQDGKLFTSEYLNTHPPFHILALDALLGIELLVQPANIDMTTLLVDGMTAYANVDENYLAGYELNTNQIIWMEKLSPGRHFGSQFSVSKDYLVSQTFDGFLVFNRRNGKLKYKYWVDNTVGDNRRGLVVMDAMTNNAIALFLDDDLQNSGKNFNQATLTALSLDKQTIAWRLGKQNSLIAPALMNQTIFSVQVDLSQLNAVDTETGQLLWSWQPPEDDTIKKFSKLVATSDVIFIATTKRVYAISLTTHKTVWQYEQYADDLALGEGKLFMFTSSNQTNPQNTVTAVNLS